MEKLLNTLINLKFRRRCGLSYGLGVLSATAFPPVFLLPALFIAFPGLMILIDRCKTAKEAFFTGLWFGIGHFMLSLYWFAHALMTDPAKYAILIPPMLIAIPTAGGLYIAFTSLVTFLTPRRLSRIIVFSCLWLIAEMLRGGVISGFPWNLIGYVWAFSDEIAQIVSVIGIYGLGLITMLIVSTPYLLLKVHEDKIYIIKNNVKYLVYAALMILMMWGWGYYRLHQADARPEGKKFTNTNIRIIQANLPAHYQWFADLRVKVFMEYLKMTQVSELKNKPEIIIWPESSATSYLNKDKIGRSMMAEIMPENSFIITGSNRLEGDKNNSKMWNTMFAIGKSGDIKAYYDKTKLVPFGEYIPFKTIFPFIDRFTGGSIDFSRGTGVKTLSFDNVPPFSPLICYEAIFPGEVIDPGDRPEWLLNVTNDVWFGNSSGPYQHFHMARMRAIEEGIPLVRAANTGISAVVDAYGRVISSLGLGESGILTARLPAFINPTIYNKYRDKTVILAIILLVGLSFLKDILRQKRL